MIDPRIYHAFVVVFALAVLVIGAAVLSWWAEMRDDLKRPGDDEDLPLDTGHDF